MSKVQGKTKLRVAGVAGLTVALFWLRWRHEAVTDPGSVPGIVDRLVWPWARWLVLLALVLFAVSRVRRRLWAAAPADAARRWMRRSNAKRGLATSGEVWLRGGWWYARRMAAVVRPSLAGLSWWRRWRTPMTAFAFRLVRVPGVLGFLVWVYATAEEVTIRIAPPRQGKTAEMANHILDAPGAVVATSTKYDLVELTAPLRERQGPVYLFNPEGLGGRGRHNSLRWTPLTGCKSPALAMMRAGYLLSGAPSVSSIGQNSGFWEGQAVRVLSRYLHAAALGDRTMPEVLEWVSHREQSGRLVLDLLALSPAGSSWRDDFRGFLDTNDDTSTSIITTMTSALGWLADPAAAAIVMPGDGENFDVAAFVRGSGTLYLLGSDRPHGTIAPLFTALTAEIFETAKLMASQRPGGRLDPALTFALDEAPLICPVPLDRWTSDAGSRGIVLHIAAQSRLQLYSKWGETDGRVIWGNAAVKLIFGGIDDERELAAFSALCGTVDEDAAESTGGRTQGRDSGAMPPRRVAVMPPERIRGLREWRVLVVRRGMSPTIGRISPAFQRRDVKAARRALRRAAVPARARRFRTVVGMTMRARRANGR